MDPAPKQLRSSPIAPTHVGFGQVRILDALCHWKLESCSELHKFIGGALKENDDKAINALVR